MWHAVAAAEDLPYRHTFHGELLGRELAIWRADDDHVNVWENRCLHRGLRLSIGMNDGRELQCRYHGWRYASRTAGCTYIPAHPADAPARTICARTFASVEQYGLIWTAQDPAATMPAVGLLAGVESRALRGVVVHAPSALVVEALKGHQFSPNGSLQGDQAQVAVEDSGPFFVTLASTEGKDSTTVVFFVQPVDAARSIVRPVLAGSLAAAERMRVLRHHSIQLTALRRIVEHEASLLPAPARIVPTTEQVPIHLAQMPERVDVRRGAPLRVRVARKWETAEGVMAFQLESVAGQLPTFQPGAHIDVHLQGGLVRQYSLTNAPGELGWYRIGVKLDPDSRGGSAALHNSVREGDVLAISEPRNNFVLRRDALRTLFIAGGIGATPLLAMAQALHYGDLNYEFHYFAQSKAHLAFPEVLAELDGSLTTHLGLTPEATGTMLEEVLTGPATHEAVYICGPGPMLEATRQIARAQGWADDVVHFEYFKNATEIDDSSTFQINLARSGLTLTVTAGETILEVLTANGIPVESSCEQGACGTCAVGVIDGVADHQDVYLTDTERRVGERLMVCVSRAQSDHLTLDI